MANTTNFGWETPDDTDLVKDGASAMRTLGNAIDTSLVDLKGGTTGQVLSKASNTDMDFTWVAQDDSNAIQNAIVDAKGDLITATAADTPARLAVGTDGQYLSADSTAATGLKWVAAPTSGENWTLVNSGGTALTGASTITISGISGANALAVFVKDASSANGSSEMYFRFNADTGSNYGYFGVRFDMDTSTFTRTKIVGESSDATIYLPCGAMSSATTSQIQSSMVVTGGNASGIKVVTINGMGTPSGSDGQDGYSYNGYWKGSATISSISITSSSGNFDSGTIWVYKA